MKYCIWNFTDQKNMYMYLFCKPQMLIAACIKIVIVNHFDIDFCNLKLLLEKVGLQFRVLDPISDGIFRPKNDE